MEVKRLGRKIKNSFYALSKRWKRNSLVIFIFVVTLLSIPFLLKSLFTQSYENKIYTSIESAPASRVALVLGAGLNEESRPSGILEDRVLTAVELYRAGKVEKIIMSGDNRAANYDEPTAMINLAVEHGVPIEDLQPDYAGRRTYDSCYRAREIFSLSEMIIITQDFHMGRAIYICNSIGINTYGVTSDRRGYRDEFILEIRDTYAFMLAVLDVNVRKPEVVLGDKIEI